MKSFVKAALVEMFRRRGYYLGPTNKIHEHSEAHWLLRAIDTLQIDTVLDVGANRGQYGQRLIEGLGFDGRVFSFEPIPDAFSTLDALASGHTNWSVYNAAVSSTAGVADFNIMVGEEFSSIHQPDASETARFDKMNAVQKVISVKTITLADAVEQMGPAKSRLLKLDVQGHEMNILESGISHLPEFAAVQMELSFKKIYKNSAGMTEVIAWMEQAGFELGAVFPNNEGHFPELVEMDAMFVNRNRL